MPRPAYHQKQIKLSVMRPAISAHEHKTPSTAAFKAVARAAEARGITGGSLTERVRRLGLDATRAKAIFMRHAEEVWDRARARGDRVAERDVFVANRVAMLMKEFRGE